VTPTLRPPAPPAEDGLGRRVTYLRLSVTDRCNYRCTYCMPEEGVPRLRHADVLSFEEAARLTAVLARRGVTRVRLTGGEPLVRRGLPELVRRLVAVPGLGAVVMTTNGDGLAAALPELCAAGLAGVNVSLDSLDPARFARVTRRGELAAVRAGIEAAARRFPAVRLNTVAIAGFNDDELGRICRFAWARGCVPRFLEHMPMSDGRLRLPGRFLSGLEIRARIVADLGGDLAPDRGDGQGQGPARYFRHSSGHLVGVIAALTERFCGACNRVRIDSTGRLHACLAHEDAAVDLRAALAAGGEAAVEEALDAALARKPAGHAFGVGGHGCATTHMVRLGG
jgi:cyclic pyranopterin phosphate synthase